MVSILFPFTCFTQLRDMQHDNIIAFVGACVESPNFWVVTAYCQKGCLGDILQNSDFSLDLTFKVSIALDIIAVCGHLRLPGFFNFEKRFAVISYFPICFTYINDTITILSHSHWYYHTRLRTLLSSRQTESRACTFSPFWHCVKYVSECNFTIKATIITNDFVLWMTYMS